MTRVKDCNGVIVSFGLWKEQETSHLARVLIYRWLHLLPKAGCLGWVRVVQFSGVSNTKKAGMAWAAAVGRHPAADVAIAFGDFTLEESQQILAGGES